MVIFVGDTPSKRTDPNQAFKGAACEKRLKEWIARLDVAEYYLINSTDNDLYSKIYTAKAIGVPIIALGNNASKALGSAEHYKLPHPSGRNRQINNKAFIDNKIMECGQFLKSHYVEI